MWVGRRLLSAGTTSGIALGRPPVQFDQKLPFGKVGPPLPHLGPDEVDDGLVFGLPVPQRLGSMKVPVGFPFAGHGVCGCLGIAGKLFDDLQALFDEPPSIACLLGDSCRQKSHPPVLPSVRTLPSAPQDSRDLEGRIQGELPYRRAQSIRRDRPEPRTATVQARPFHTSDYPEFSQLCV